MFKASEDRRNKSYDSLYVLGAILVVLEVVFALDVVLRDVLINNQGWGNIFPITITLMVEAIIIVIMILINHRRDRNVFALIPAIYIMIRSSYGLLFNYGGIPMVVLRVSQIVICVLVFATVLIGKRNKISG